jgi:hypothetical protein
MTKRSFAIAVIATALVALAVGVASAHKVSYSTKTTFKTKRVPGTMGPGTEVYSGEVRSPDNETRCIRNRTVTVTHRGVVLGTDFSGNSGAWEITISEQGGPDTGEELVATVKRRQSGKRPKHKHVCGRATATAKAP